MDITERKHAEALRQQLLDDVQAISNGVSDGLLVADVETRRFVRSNPAISKMLGYSETEFLSMSVEDIHPADKLPAVLEMFDRLASGRLAKALDIPLRRKDGSICYADVSASLISFRERRCAAGFFHDVTERKRAEETLRRSEDRYRSLFNEMTEGFALHEILCDEQGVPCDYRFLEVNPAFEQLTGLNRDEVVGKTMRAVLPEEDAFWIKTYGDVAISGQAARLERFSPVLSKHYDVYAYSPAPGQFATIFGDITARKEIEEALRQSEQRSRCIIEASPDGIIQLGLDTRVLMVNQQAASLAGFRDVDEVIAAGVTGFDMSAPEDRQRAAENIRRIVEEDVFISAEYVCIRLDGQRVPVEINTSLLKDNKGTPTGMICVLRDISERKLAEEALREREEVYSAIVNQAADGITLIDAETLRFVEFNDAACDGLGYSREEFAALRLTDIQAVLTPDEVAQSHLGPCGRPAAACSRTNSAARTVRFAIAASAFAWSKSAAASSWPIFGWISPSARPTNGKSND